MKDTVKSHLPASRSKQGGWDFKGSLLQAGRSNIRLTFERALEIKLAGQLNRARRLRISSSIDGLID
jgi:hypothetical protein